jgi:thiamine-phosphate pyrophosphorylase
MTETRVRVHARLGGLYAITPEDTDTDRLVRRMRACLEGGASAVQYRAKSTAPQLALLQARALHQLCKRFDVPLIINDNVELALAIDSDGIHLGREDGDVSAARIRLGGKIVGASCYDDFARAERCIDAGADYVAFGSFFASTTKPNATSASHSLLTAARARGINSVAIGGITPDNAGSLITAGADALAVIGGLFASQDLVQIRAAAAAFSRLFKKS